LFGIGVGDEHNPYASIEIATVVTNGCAKTAPVLICSMLANFLVYSSTCIPDDILEQADTIISQDRW
jgi:hypothetical protein